jgi:hypothetical protein
MAILELIDNGLSVISNDALEHLTSEDYTKLIRTKNSLLEIYGNLKIRREV